MSFKLFGVRIEISFLFTALTAFLLVFNINESIKLGIIFSLLHEMGHLVAIVLCKEKPERISFGLFGMTIFRKNDISQNYKKEIITALAGPFTNFFAALIFYLIYLYYGNKMLVSFIAVNTVIGMFNIMPVFSLDGGRALESILKISFEQATSERIMKAVSFAVLVVMMGTGFYILISTGYNFTFLAISLYLTAMLFIKC